MHLFLELRPDIYHLLGSASNEIQSKVSTASRLHLTIRKNHWMEKFYKLNFTKNMYIIIPNKNYIDLLKH